MRKYLVMILTALMLCNVSSASTAAEHTTDTPVLLAQEEIDLYCEIFPEYSEKMQEKYEKALLKEYKSIEKGKVHKTIKVIKKIERIIGKDEYSLFEMDDGGIVIGGIRGGEVIEVPESMVPMTLGQGITGGTVTSAGGVTLYRNREVFLSYVPIGGNITIKADCTIASNDYDYLERRSGAYPQYTTYYTGGGVWQYNTSRLFTPYDQVNIRPIETSSAPALEYWPIEILLGMTYEGGQWVWTYSNFKFGIQIRNNTASYYLNTI